jgi:hypothetical protein
MRTSCSARFAWRCQLVSVLIKDTTEPNMSTGIPANPIAEGLFPKARGQLLSLFFGQPEKEYYLREIERLTGLGLGQVQRETKRLVDAGILLRTAKGQHVYFSANSQCPAYEPLYGLVKISTGVVGQLPSRSHLTRTRSGQPLYLAP